jgi:histidinol-phosphate aminotransferase
VTVTENTLPVPGQDDLFRLAKGYYTTKALLALWRLGMLERAVAGESLHPATEAARLGADPDLIKPLFDYLIVRGFLEAADGGSYRLTARAMGDAPYYGYLSTMVGAYEPVFMRIEDLVSGKVSYGTDVKRSYEEMVHGLTALEDHLMGPVAEVAKEGATKVLDLGCGSARMLARICQLSDGIRAVGVDRNPDSCATARKTVADAGLGDRIAIVEGDAFGLASLPADVTAGVDMISVMFLLHEILRQRGRAGVIRLLTDIAAMVGPGGRLVMVEVSGTVQHSYRENQLFVPEYELLHEYTNQRLAPRSDWEAMVAEAGMEVVEVRPVDMCQAFCLVASPTAGGGATGEA